ncbi:MAG: ribonucrease [Solirubrobacteraceae bacterium]|jgi:ribonuclease Y|nr:ribonucrease [Solirubrobacteraceae bacterium]MEA2189638.1 ribonucrease [Solirubrobacteraceae bacterium]MEA2231037.1 ribonucrease [Solirubrobacteraceae bacterium]
MELIVAAAILAGAIALAFGRHQRQPSASDDMPSSREELARAEERVNVRAEELDRRARELDDQTRALEAEREQLARRRREHEQALEQISGLSAGQAKERLMTEITDQVRHESARHIREIEEETKRDAERRVRSILSVAMQRLAASHAAETTVSVVQLPSDDMKGRIIGREGRNIRALENITGVDVIIDDTPSAVVLSAFDGVRREIARMTLEKLLTDGRIHPARIEEAYYQAKSELESHLVQAGEDAAFESGVQGLDAEIIKTLGRLKFRTSYGQNVLSHSVECAQLAAMMAEELGASPKMAARAALLHDIGKAVSHEVEGPHALVGGDLARRHGESEAVAHAMEAHHNEVEPQTIEAVIVQAADALSGARPGARGESLESYVKRLRELEHIADRHDGVDKVYAMQAGREIRVIVSPTTVDDDAAMLLSREIAREIERELEYPGQIKVTVIRESRAVEFAK